MKKKEFQQIWETVAQDLKDAIIRGELKGGQRLRIEELSEKYGVSNTPIRDAFRYLANLGFVENIPRRMVVVKEIALEEVEEIYTIQSVLEGLAAGLAVRNCSPEDLKRFEQLYQRMEESVRRGDVQAYSEADVEFHDAFLRLSRNARLARMVGNARDHIARFRFIMLRHPGRLEESLQEHERIMDAFRRNDAETADREVRLHIQVSADLLKRIVSQENRSAVLLGAERASGDDLPGGGARKEG